MKSADLGKVIAAERKRRKLTQTELGRMLGVSQAAVAYWEKGKNRPGRGHMSLLVRVFELSDEAWRPT